MSYPVIDQVSQLRLSLVSSHHHHQNQMTMSDPALNSTLLGANCTNLYNHRAVARVLMPMVYSVVCLLGLLGNALALQVIRSNWNKLNSTTLYSANLAVSDLLFCLALPLRIIYYGMGFNWLLGEALCKLTALLFYLNCYAGVNFMTCLAVDRFLAVVLQMRLSKLRKVQNVRYICLVVWLVVLAQTLPLLGMPMTHTEIDGRITCMEYPNFESVQGLPYMLIGAVILGYGFPLATILICYSVLSYKLQQAAKGNHLTERSGSTHKARGVIAGVVLVFVVCFSPYHLDLLQYMIRKLIYDPDCGELQAFQISLHITVCLMNFNTCLDPFVYFFACKGYKRKVLKILKRQVSTSFTSVGRTSPESSGTHDNYLHHQRTKSRHHKDVALSPVENGS
ncbi:G-protein coupled receptor 183-B-like [Astyanax mexicanus]|uniref:G-protein coupled receptor 183-B-like n=2 Tax=Astyanax mexicanus TaxID=7994 RepID=A0A8T2KXZ2_ASTMX|nr:G-protein coupled receptor 183-B-like [Astyanax mexicanus]